jgi:hypothetical protein
MQVGDRIRFTKTLDAPATGDRPAIIYAVCGQLGRITRVGGCTEGYWAIADGWPHPFGVSDDEFEKVRTFNAGDVCPECAKRITDSPKGVLFDAGNGTLGLRCTVCGFATCGGQG